jgi:hypothetical protein
MLLGIVITHEIGHFFGLDHAVAGIMISRFRYTQVMQGAAGLLRFDGQEEAVRKAVANWRQKS